MKERKRWKFSAPQLAELETIFLRQPKPSSQERKELAEKLCIPVKTVQIWFQNARAKTKRNGNFSFTTSSANQIHQTSTTLSEFSSDTHQSESSSVTPYSPMDNPTREFISGSQSIPAFDVSNASSNWLNSPDSIQQHRQIPDVTLQLHVASIPPVLSPDIPPSTRSCVPIHSSYPAFLHSPIHGSHHVSDYNFPTSPCLQVSQPMSAHIPEYYTSIRTPENRSTVVSDSIQSRPLSINSLAASIPATTFVPFLSSTSSFSHQTSGDLNANANSYVLPDFAWWSSVPRIN